MSTNNKKQRRDELNKVSGGLAIGPSLNFRDMEISDMKITDNSSDSKIDDSKKMTTNPKRPERVCVNLPCGFRW